MKIKTVQNIENEVEKLDKTKKEKIGWMIVAEKSMKKIWDNKKDDEIWNKYL